MRTLCGIVAVVATAGSLLSVRAAEPPTALSVGERCHVIRLPDGTLVADLTRVSTANGATWTEPPGLFNLPTELDVARRGMSLVDRDGEIHVFWMVRPEDAAHPPENELQIPHGELLDRRIDIWYTRSRNGRTTWEPARMIWMGYTGSLNSVIQMNNGRILLPFSCMTSRSWGNRGDGLDAFTYMGYFDSTLIYSDDAGDTWRLADAVKTPTPNLETYGAIEPVVIQLRDGRVWMLIRTQLGRFWESFSDNGATWSAPRPSNLISSDSPAGIVRLDDGRIVLFWNNCLRFPYAYGGRHVLHAAISDDEGKTWRGYREVARDPKRDQPPPSRGDFGTAYPMPTVVNDGKVMYATGQGEGRALLMLLDPEWLLETHQEADFANRQEEWSIFGTRGVEFLDHPQKPGAKVLSIRKTEPDWPACAVWNFPNGLSGRLRLRIMLNRGFRGALLGLTDHFSVPFDLEDRFYNVFNLEILPEGRLMAGAKLQAGRYYDLALEWSVPRRECRVLLDGRGVGTLPLLRQTSGVNYMRLRSTAERTDRRGMIIEPPVADVAPY
jgi:hypothetical protein